MAEGVSAKLGYTFAPANVYFGVAAIARGTYGAITWQSAPVQIKGFDAFQIPEPAHPDAATRQEIDNYEFGAAILALLQAVLGASAFGFSGDYWFWPMTYVVAALTLASAGAYLGPWIRHMGH